LASIQRNSARSLRSGLAVAALATCQLGCWEEIRYEPQPEQVQPAHDLASSGDPAADNAGNSAAEPLQTPTSGAAPAEAVSSTESPATDQAPAVDVAATPLESPPLQLAAEAESPVSNADGEAEDTSLEPAGDDLFPPTAGSLPNASPLQRSELWRAASKWSFAAGICAKNLPPERYESYLQDAEAAAGELSLTLPPLPTRDPGEPASRIEAAVIATLDGPPAQELVRAAAERFGDNAGGLVELAVRSNLLLLAYSPRRADVAAQAAQFANAAESSGLPRDLWRPIADLLDARGDYIDVRSAVFKLHESVEQHLAAEARSQD
jgi:hypothetical protein